MGSRTGFEKDDYFSITRIYPYTKISGGMCLVERDEIYATGVG